MDGPVNEISEDKQKLLNDKKMTTHFLTAPTKNARESNLFGVNIQDDWKVSSNLKIFIINFLTIILTIFSVISILK